MAFFQQNSVNSKATDCSAALFFAYCGQNFDPQKLFFTTPCNLATFPFFGAKSLVK